MIEITVVWTCDKCGKKVKQNRQHYGVLDEYIVKRPTNWKNSIGYFAAVCESCSNELEEPKPITPIVIEAWTTLGKGKYLVSFADKDTYNTFLLHAMRFGRQVGKHFTYPKILYEVTATYNAEEVMKYLEDICSRPR